MANSRIVFLALFAVALAAVFLPSAAVGYTLLYSLNFDNLPLGPPVDEQVMGFPNAFTHTPPGGWIRDNSNFPEPFNPLFGVFEWKGWSFANSGFWAAAQKTSDDFPGRSEFENASGTIAVADSDLWNDKVDPANGIGFFDSTLRTLPINISSAIMLNEQISVGFSASWRGECCDDGAGFNPNGNNQTFVVEAIYNNIIVQPMLRWESAPFIDSWEPSINPAHTPNPLFKANSLNELVVIDLNPPPGVSTLALRWRLQNAGEDGWLALDELAVSSACGVTKGDMNLDCWVNTADIPDWVLGLRNPDAYFDKYPPNFPERRGSENGFKLDFDEAEWFLQQLNDAGAHATIDDILAALNPSVPEPGTLNLVIYAAVITTLVLHRRC